MYYIINLFDEAPEDLIEAVNCYIPRNSLRIGNYLHINSDTLIFFRAYKNIADTYEYIDIEKLKEILLLKHLKE